MPKASPALPSVATLIRDRMKAADLLQGDLATLMRVSPAAVHYLVNGRIRITARMAQKLAAHLGETAIWWMDRQRDADLAKVATEGAA